MEPVLESFATMFAYPWSKPTGAVADAEAAAASLPPAVKGHLRAFARSLARMPLDRLQEAYSTLFELDPACPPYVGFHAFGETYQRSAFLVALAGRCRDVGVEPRGELADHLSVVLQFLARSPDAAEREELINLVLRPALDRMVAKAKKSPYGRALEALRLMLLAGPGGAPKARSRKAVAKGASGGAAC